MIDGSKCRHLNGDLFFFPSMIPEEHRMKSRADYRPGAIVATEPVKRVDGRDTVGQAEFVQSLFGVAA
jgi:hypothetical protein